MISQYFKLPIVSNRGGKHFRISFVKFDSFTDLRQKNHSQKGKDFELFDSRSQFTVIYCLNKRKRYENSSPDAEFNQPSFIYIAAFIKMKTQSTPLVINVCNPTIKHVKVGEVAYIYNPGIMCL